VSSGSGQGLSFASAPGAVALASFVLAACGLRFRTTIRDQIVDQALARRHVSEQSAQSLGCRPTPLCFWIGGLALYRGHAWRDRTSRPAYDPPVNIRRMRPHELDAA